MFDKDRGGCYNILIFYSYFFESAAVCPAKSGRGYITHSICRRRNGLYMKRREARETALCLIYEYSFNNEFTPQQVFETAMEQREEKPSAFAKQLYFGTCEHMAELDEKIATAAENWRIERISRVSLTVLRMCAFELLFMPDTEKEIVINEALELTRKYDDEKAVAFVNGVIGRIINTGQ